MKNILGQPRAVSLLMHQIENNRMAHSYLFLGPQGVGKTTTALAVAKSLVCTESRKGCGTCSACRRTEAGMHPDVHVIEKGAEASEIKIDQIRQLCSDLSLTSFEAGKKVAVIADAERLNMEASNAFLKTLEEPSGQTVMILTAVNRKSLLDTIVSRCRIVRFHHLSDAAVEEILKKEGMDPAAAAVVSTLCAGNLNRARSLSDMDLSVRRMWLVEKIPSLSKVNPVDLADQLKEKCGGKSLAQTRESIAVYLGFLYLLLRDVRIVQLDVQPPRWYSGDCADTVRRIAAGTTERGVCSMMESVDRCRNEIESNVKPEFSLTQMFVSMREAMA